MQYDIYIHPRLGDDSADGSRGCPLRTGEGLIKYCMECEKVNVNVIAWIPDMNLWVRIGA